MPPTPKWEVPEPEDAEAKRLVMQGSLKTAQFLRRASELMRGGPPSLAAHLAFGARRAYDSAQATTDVPLKIKKSLKSADHCDYCWFPYAASTSSASEPQPPTTSSTATRKCAVCKSSRWRKRSSVMKTPKAAVATEESVAASPVFATPVFTQQTPGSQLSSVSRSVAKKKKASRLSLLVAETPKTTDSSLASFLNALG
ncbi:unnamed protein product, partial [Mesorhabditis spiculigera]